MTPESEAWAAVQFAGGVFLLAFLWYLLVEQYDAWQARRRQRQFEQQLSLVQRKQRVWTPSSGDGIKPPRQRF